MHQDVTNMDLLIGQNSYTNPLFIHLFSKKSHAFLSILEHHDTEFELELNASGQTKLS